MLSREYISRLNSEGTQKASREDLQPYIAKIDGDEDVKKCKKLGDYVPEGWKRVNTFFVDSSGFGTEGELALTFGQFLKKVKQGNGYGLGKEGQFQINVHEYKRV